MVENGFRMAVRLSNDGLQINREAPENICDNIGEAHPVLHGQRAERCRDKVGQSSRNLHGRITAHL